jgi:hypothetical protein
MGHGAMGGDVVDRDPGPARDFCVMRRAADGAGFCLMGHSGCWIWDDDGRRLRACHYAEPA